MSEAKAIGGKIVTKPFLILGGFAALGLFFILKRFIFGLGAVSNMSDGYPWGIFIAYDVVVGTALACGGYAMALLVYIFNKGEFHHALRPALLASVFGYTLAGMSVFLDVGRYWQIYNIFLPGYAQANSVLFEVALCIGTYIFILWLEFSPTFLEFLQKHKLLKAFNRMMFVLIAIGILLPTMHQSSLGSLLLVAGSKLSPLWHSGSLPVLYLMSAIAMGFGIVMFESILSSSGFKRPLETEMLSKLGRIVAPLIGAYLVVRFGDLIVRGHAGEMFTSGWDSVLFWLENLLYGAAMVLLFRKEFNRRPHKLFLAATCLLLAGAGYRFNAYIVAYNPGEGWHYFPSFSELSITLGLISIEIMAYMVIVKKMPVLPKVKA